MHVYYRAFQVKFWFPSHHFISLPPFHITMYNRTRVRLYRYFGVISELMFGYTSLYLPFTLLNGSAEFTEDRIILGTRRHLERTALGSSFIFGII